MLSPYAGISDYGSLQAALGTGKSDIGIETVAGSRGEFQSPPRLQGLDGRGAFHAP